MISKRLFYFNQEEYLCNFKKMNKVYIKNISFIILIMVVKLSTFLWEEEYTICYQIYVGGTYIMRRQDNDMVNGTKLLNIANISRGKRDGILKNEKEKVIIKSGDIYLKGIWITFSSAKLLAIQHNIEPLVFPLFEDDPSMFLYL
jgi:hypothetical protein